MYTHGHHESVLRSHRWRTAENSAAYLLPHLAPGASLLDVGSGPGTITVDLADRVSPGHVTALEATEAAVSLTRAEAERQGRMDLSYVVGDVHAMEFADATFDVVHAHQVLQHLADPVKALAEMRRVCRPGGLVAARDSDYAAFTWFPQLPELDEWLALYRRIARQNSGEPDAGRRMLSWTRAAGFTDVTPSATTSAVRVRFFQDASWPGLVR
jgi:ubiquinone/menaquinone biosynthesis C-methylase UbiE